MVSSTDTFFSIVFYTAYTNRARIGQAGYGITGQDRAGAPPYLPSRIYTVHLYYSFAYITLSVNSTNIFTELKTCNSSYHASVANRWTAAVRAYTTH